MFVNSGIKYLIGLAYIALPADINRDIYIADCYKNLHVSIRGEDGLFLNRVPVSPEVLNWLEFPDKPQDLGTAIVYGTNEFNHQPYVMFRFLDRKDIGDMREGMFQLRRKYQGQVVEISGSAKEGFLNVFMNTKSNPAQLSLFVHNDNKDAQVDIDVTGDVTANITGALESTQTSLNFTTVDDNDNSASFQQTATVNKFYGKKLQLNDGSENAILGQKFKTWASNLVDAIAAITVFTGDAGTQPIINKIQVQALKQQIDSFLSQEMYLNK